MKQNSSQKYFAWQEGYGSFSVSYSSIEKVLHHYRGLITFKIYFTPRSAIFAQALNWLHAGLATVAATAAKNQ